MSNSDIGKDGVAQDGCVQEKHPGGRPTDYKPEYCQLIIQYFSDFDCPFETVYDKHEKPHQLFRGFPTFEEFARKIGVTAKTLENWTKNEEFLLSYTQCKEIQRHFLLIGGLSGAYQSNITQLLLGHNHGIIQKTENKNDNKHSGELNVKTRVVMVPRKERAEVQTSQLEKKEDE